MAPRSTRPVSRTAALLTCLLLAFPLVPQGSAAGALGPSTQPTGITVRQGEVQIISGGHATNFLTTGDAFRIQFPVYNYGPTNITDGRIFAYLHNDNPNPADPARLEQDRFPSSTNDESWICWSFKLLPRALSSTGDVLPSSIVTQSDLITLPSNVPSAGINVTVIVNPQTAPTVANVNNNGCSTGTTEPTHASGFDTAVGYFVNNLRPDYVFSSYTWCYGTPEDSTEDCTALTQSNLWNHTYSSNDPSMAGTHHPTYLEVTYQVQGGWINLTDYGGPCNGFGGAANAACTNEPRQLDTFFFNTSAVLNGSLSLLSPVDVTNSWKYVQPVGKTQQAQQGTYNASFIHPYLAPDTAGVSRVKQRVGTIDLTDLYGGYSLNMTIDPAGVLRQNVTKFDQLTATLPVAYTDFVGNFTVDPTMAVTKDKAYSTANVDLSHIAYTVINNGSIARDAHIQWYLDSPRDCAGNRTITGVPPFHGDWNAAILAGNTKFTLAEAANNACKSLQTVNPPSPSDSDRSKWATYLSPGTHMLNISVDWTDHVDANGVPDQQNITTEPSETNNNQSLMLWVKDTSAPTFPSDTSVTAHIPVPSSTDPNQVTPPEKRLFHPDENIFVRQVISDDSHSDLNATVVFVLDSNASVTRNYTLPPGTRTNDPSFTPFETNITDFGFATNATEENWTLHVRAIDAFNNSANTTTPVHIKLDRWPIQTMDAEQIWNHTFASSPETSYAIRDNMSFNYSDDSPILAAIEHIYPENTGIPNQANVSYNLNVTYFPAKPAYGNVTLDGTNFFPQFRCPAGTNQGPAPVPVPSPGQTPPPDTCATTGGTDYGVMSVPGVTKSWGAPGQWNVSVFIKDLSGQVRIINRTFRLIDNPPKIIDHRFFDKDTLDTTSADAGHQLHVNLTVQDDAVTAGLGPRAFLNFTRPSDGVFAGNISIGNRTDTTPNPKGNALYQFNWDYNITTGRGQMLGVGGLLNVRLDVVDENGNWNTTKIVDNFSLNDTSPPTLLNYTVEPSTQQTGGDVLYTFQVTDETNVTGKLTFSKNGATVRTMTLTPDPDTPASLAGGYSAFHALVNFTDEGQYDWEFKAFDSLGKPSANSYKGLLTIKDNLGPRFEIHSPAFVANGTRYGTAAPRIEVLTFDPDGIDESSIRLTIDDESIPCLRGATTGCVLSDSPAGAIPGIVLSYQWPATRAFQHGDTVTVNVSAFDKSDPPLLSYSPFSFVVDASPPTVRLVSFDPHYPSFDARPWNVSLATKFVLSADDPLNGGPSTGVGAIKFSLLGSNTELTYNGPFTLASLGSLYTGPKVYTLSYWAEDGVGNTNKGKANTTISVYVDDSPPSLTREIFPQGRYINASFSDGPPGPGAVGVSRVVLWYRVNDQAWTPAAMNPPVITNGDWTGLLPEGRKGDKIAWYVQAWDNLNNTETVGNETSPQGTYSVDNHPPVLKLVAPVVGDKVSRGLDITWTATDADNDPLVFGVYLKQPGKQQYTEIQKLDSPVNLHYLMDTSKYADGEYTVRVTASDGQYVQISEAAVTFQNRASAIGNVQTDSKQTQPGQKVLITAQITKAQAQVEARLFVDGQRVGSYPMNDDGKDGDAVAGDGTYSALVPIDTPGDYSVEIFTQYTEDGQIQTRSLPDAASFSAVLTPGYVMQEYGAQLVLVGVLTIAAVGVAVFFIARRR